MDNVVILPTNTDAERSILGAILLDDKAYDEAAANGPERALPASYRSRIWSRSAMLSAQRR